MIQTIKIKWNDEHIQYIKELQKQGYSSEKAVEVFNKHFNCKTSGRYLRQKARKAGYPFSNLDRKSVSSHTDVSKKAIKHVQNKDGSITSTIETVINSEPNMSPKFLLEAHNYDPAKWKVKQSVSNQWSVISTKRGKQFNFQSKIVVEPISNEINTDELINLIVSHKEPYKREPPILLQSDSYLVVPAFDTHFNGETLKTYTKSLNKELNLINSKRWQDTCLILGGDVAHVDSFNSTTTKGTQLETTDVARTVDEMEIYFETLISAILKHSNHLQLISTFGNHDKTVGYLFARLLERAYRNQPNMSFDIEPSQFKAYMLGRNFIGATHGNKGQKNYVANFASRFAEMWGRAKNRELFTGHLHTEMSKDLGGFVQRQVSTRKPTDTWTDELGVVATKNFELVQYSKEETEAVYYV
ncbi:hypothetical protein [Liquorilactobacillus mali]|uniref:hypothetical protein n=1 Tax=Liquorilactobacillus mali TaxID=1618 RepID=UPI002952B09B|nr:hypothetical protein [Liquorilactobacillus mali]